MSVKSIEINNKNKKSSDVDVVTLYLTIFVIAICGIVYELIIGTISSYLLGDAIFQFSITIGLYMSAMGLGAYLSKFITKNLFDFFVLIEILIGFIGGLSALILFWTYSSTDMYEIFMYFTILFIGTMVGLELPLLIRILEQKESLDINVAHTLGYDYIGGLIGSLIFPLILLPFIGIIKTSCLIGILNLLVVFINYWKNFKLLRHIKSLSILSIIVFFILIFTLFMNNPITNYIEQRLYRDKIIFTKQTNYQKIIITRNQKDIRLFLDGNLQFCSIDEYRYHESLVHVPLSFIKNLENVVVLGGGDGLAVREILKYASVKQITLIDIDPEITQISKNYTPLVEINKGSLNDPRVKIKNIDAYKFLEKDLQLYSAIIIDLPDPDNINLSKLYSKEFYQIAKKRLKKDGVIVTQSTSPFFSKQAFWCINKTLESTDLYVYPYHVDVPSFGDWGFNMAFFYKLNITDLKIKVPTKFLNTEVVKTLFIFSPDILLDKDEIKVNSIIEPVILNYYITGWNNISE